MSANSSMVGLYYIKESTPGETPAAQLRGLRYTSESIEDTTQTTQSEEVVTDRQVTDVVRTAFGSQGDVNFELSYGAFDDLIEGVMMAAWSPDTPSSGTDQIANGVTPVSFTFERAYTDVNSYESWAGCRIGSMSLSIAPGSIITGSFSILGKGGVPATSSVGTGQPIAAPTHGVMNAIDHVAVVEEGGSGINGVVELTLDIDNGLFSSPQVGSIDPYAIGIGQFVCSGTLAVYYQDKALIEKYTKFQATSIAFELEDAAGNAYSIVIPRLKFTSGSAPGQGNRQGVVSRFNWSAMKDPSTGKTIIIQRTPAST